MEDDHAYGGTPDPADRGRAGNTHRTKKDKKEKKKQRKRRNQDAAPLAETPIAPSPAPSGRYGQSNMAVTMLQDSSAGGTSTNYAAFFEPGETGAEGSDQRVTVYGAFPTEQRFARPAKARSPMPSFQERGRNEEESQPLTGSDSPATPSRRASLFSRLNILSRGASPTGSPTAAVTNRYDSALSFNVLQGERIDLSQLPSQPINKSTITIDSWVHLAATTINTLRQLSLSQFSLDPVQENLYSAALLANYYLKQATANNFKMDDKYKSLRGEMPTSFIRSLINLLLFRRTDIVNARALTDKKLLFSGENSKGSKLFAKLEKYKRVFRIFPTDSDLDFFIGYFGDARNDWTAVDLEAQFNPNLQLAIQLLLHIQDTQTDKAKQLRQAILNSNPSYVDKLIGGRTHKEQAIIRRPIQTTLALRAELLPEYAPHIEALRSLGNQRCYVISKFESGESNQQALEIAKAAMDLLNLKVSKLSEDSNFNYSPVETHAIHLLHNQLVYLFEFLRKFNPAESIYYPNDSFWMQAVSEFEIKELINSLERYRGLGQFPDSIGLENTSLNVLHKAVQFFLSSVYRTTEKTRVALYDGLEFNTIDEAYAAVKKALLSYFKSIEYFYPDVSQYFRPPEPAGPKPRPTPPERRAAPPTRPAPRPPSGEYVTTSVLAAVAPGGPAAVVSQPAAAPPAEGGGVIAMSPEQLEAALRK